jgi:hypothetical protein
VRFSAESWNRKLHYYLGLYFLLFLWLFSLTGLLLNHPRWALAQTSFQRIERRYETPIDVPRGETDLARARDVMRQLNLEGEIDWPASGQKPGRFEFNVSRPQDASTIDVDLTRTLAMVRHFDNHPWAAFRIFHTFSGSRYNAPAATRDWALTTMWTLSMDALAAGLVVMVLGSYYMWYRLKPKRRLGAAVLIAGFLACGLFLAALM